MSARENRRQAEYWWKVATARERTAEWFNVGDPKRAEYFDLAREARVIATEFELGRRNAKERAQ